MFSGEQIATLEYYGEKDILNPEFKHKEKTLTYNIIRNTEGSLTIIGNYSVISPSILLKKLGAIREKLKDGSFLDLSHKPRESITPEDLMNTPYDGVLLQNTISEELESELGTIVLIKNLSEEEKK